MKPVGIEFSEARRLCAPLYLSDDDRNLVVRAGLLLLVARTDAGIPVVRDDLLRIAFYAPESSGEL